MPGRGNENKIKKNVIILQSDVSRCVRAQACVPGASIVGCTVHSEYIEVSAARRRARAAERGGAQAAAVHQPAEPAHHAPHLRVQRPPRRRRPRQVHIFVFHDSTTGWKCQRTIYGNSM